MNFALFGGWRGRARRRPIAGWCANRMRAWTAPGPSGRKADPGAGHPSVEIVMLTAIPCALALLAADVRTGSHCW